MFKKIMPSLLLGFILSTYLIAMDNPPISHVIDHKTKSLVLCDGESIQYFKDLSFETWAKNGSTVKGIEIDFTFLKKNEKIIYITQVKNEENIKYAVLTSLGNLYQLESLVDESVKPHLIEDTDTPLSQFVVINNFNDEMILLDNQKKMISLLYITAARYDVENNLETDPNIMNDKCKFEGMLINIYGFDYNEEIALGGCLHLSQLHEENKCDLRTPIILCTDGRVIATDKDTLKDVKISSLAATKNGLFGLTDKKELFFYGKDIKNKKITISYKGDNLNISDIFGAGLGLYIVDDNQRLYFIKNTCPVSKDNRFFISNNIIKFENLSLSNMKSFGLKACDRHKFNDDQDNFIFIKNGKEIFGIKNDQAIDLQHISKQFWTSELHKELGNDFKNKVLFIMLSFKDIAKSKHLVMPKPILFIIIDTLYQQEKSNSKTQQKK